MTISTQCLMCEHYTGFSTCDAFPEKIPQEIFDGTFDHTEAYPGDNGIRFEEIKKRGVEKMIEIDIALLHKIQKRVWVKPTSKRKGHYRKIKGAKEEVRVVPYSEQFKSKTPIGMTLEEFLANPVEGYVHDPILDREENIGSRVDRITHLSDAWFGFDDAARQARLLHHEIGHDLMSMGYNESYADVLAPFEGEGYKGGLAGPFGLHWTAEEIIADTYMALWHPNVREHKTSRNFNLLMRVVEMSKKMGLLLPDNIEEKLKTEWSGVEIETVKPIEPPKPSILDGTGKIANLSETIRTEILMNWGFGSSDSKLKSMAESMAGSDLDITGAELADWAKSVRDQLVKRDVIELPSGDITPDKFVDWANAVKSARTVEKMIEIDMESLTKAKQRVHVKQTATRKAHYRTQEVGRKEPEPVKKKSPREGTGRIAGLPDKMRDEILELRRLGDSGAKIKSAIENMIDASEDPNIKYDLAGKGIIKDSAGGASLNVNAQSLVDWAKSRGVGATTKRRTAKVIAAEAKESEEKQFKDANEKLARVKTENQTLKDDLEREKKSHKESEAIRDKLRSDNFILREKLKTC